MEQRFGDLPSEQLGRTPAVQWTAGEVARFQVEQDLELNGQTNACGQSVQAWRSRTDLLAFWRDFGSFAQGELGVTDIVPIWWFEGITLQRKVFRIWNDIHHGVLKADFRLHCLRTC